MNITSLTKVKNLATIAVSLITWVTLLMQYYGSGVPVHYLLHNKDLAAFSNWWGGIILPAITWFLIARINQNILLQPTEQQQAFAKRILIGFVAAITWGVLLSAGFSFGYTQLSSTLFFGIPLIALFIKVYQEQFILGFVLSMSVVFGAILPLIFATLIGTVSAIVYHLVHFIITQIKNMNKTAS